MIDVGWPATSSIAWQSSVAAFIIPLGIIVNVVLLVTKSDKDDECRYLEFLALYVYSSNGLCRIRQYLASVISSSYFPNYLFESSRLDSTDDE
ncbi:PTS transporter subunit IIC [Staphylococcus aureus]